MFTIPILAWIQYDEESCYMLNSKMLLPCEDYSMKYFCLPGSDVVSRDGAAGSVGLMVLHRCPRDGAHSPHCGLPDILS